MAPPGDPSAPRPGPQPPGRLTPLGWLLIGALPVLLALVFIVGRGTVAVIAFVLVALDVLLLASALIAPPRRRGPRGLGRS